MSSPNIRLQSTECSDWVSTTLSAIADVVGGGTPSTSEESYWNGDVQWFTPSEITCKYVSSSIRTISEEGVRNSSAKPLPKGSILFTSRATLGLSAINRSDKIVTTNQGFQSIIPKDGWSSEFVYYLVNQDSFLREVKKRATGSTFPEISPTALKSIIVNVPGSINEQHKIAEFFTALDEKIQFLGKKLKLKHSLKHSMMDKVFSQNVRFQSDTCEPYQDWIALELGSCCAFYAGQTPKSTCSDYYGGEINWVASGDLNRGVIFDTEKTITNAGLNSANLKIIPKGSFVIALFGLEAENVCGNCGLLGIDAAINQACLNIKPNEEILLTKYLFYYYQHFGKSFCKSNAQGTKQQNLNIELISQFAIKIPCIEEQRKICVFFDQIEKSILLLNRKLCCLKELKKAFMQRMFV